MQDFGENQRFHKSACNFVYNMYAHEIFNGDVIIEPFVYIPGFDFCKYGNR